MISRLAITTCFTSILHGFIGLTICLIVHKIDLCGMLLNCGAGPGGAGPGGENVQTFKKGGGVAGSGHKKKR